MFVDNKMKKIKDLAGGGRSQGNERIAALRSKNGVGVFEFEANTYDFRKFLLRCFNSTINLENVFDFDALLAFVYFTLVIGFCKRDFMTERVKTVNCFLVKSDQVAHKQPEKGKRHNEGYPFAR